MARRTRLGWVLREQGRRQDWLAEQVGVDPSHISRIVHGLFPSQATAEKIADALDVEVSELWPELGEQAA